jgi:hypothetical protein
MYKVLAIGQDNIGEFAMYTNIEFLDEEPIENIVAALNYDFDKMIYFGYPHVIEAEKSRVQRFLKEECGVSTVEFVKVSETDFGSVIASMRSIIKRELNEGNKVSLDITGGESLVLVAAGILSREFNLPISMCDIETDTLIECNEGAEHSVRVAAPKRKIQLDLHKYIRMQGGIIKDGADEPIYYSLGKELIEKMYEISKNNADAWNDFSTMVAKNAKDNKASDNYDDNDICIKKPKNIKNLNEASAADKEASIRYGQYIKILNELQSIGVVKSIESKTMVIYRHRSDVTKALLSKGGTLLELHTFYREKDKSDDCLRSVRLDWDGVIHEKPSDDVNNEVDVMTLNGYIPTFISCKSGNMDKDQALHPIYELETVAARFGGKYAKKVFATVQPLRKVYIERAEALGIEVREMQNEMKGE